MNYDLIIRSRARHEFEKFFTDSERLQHDCDSILCMIPSVDAVPVSELLSLRDNLYEDNLITMRGLRNLNMLISKYEGGKDHALD